MLYSNMGLLTEGKEGTMSNFVKLPSGQVVNTNRFVNTDEGLQYNPNNEVYFRIYDNYTTEDGVPTWFFGADARALYAYLLAQAVTIGEDGKPVEAEMEMVR